MSTSLFGAVVSFPSGNAKSLMFKLDATTINVLKLADAGVASGRYYQLARNGN
jgi:hypothetical protein